MFKVRWLNTGTIFHHLQSLSENTFLKGHSCSNPGMGLMPRITGATTWSVIKTDNYIGLF